MSYSFGTHQVNTRKAHDCVWCGEGIAINWVAIVHEYINDNGDFGRDYWHPVCDRACKYHDVEEFEPYSQPRGNYDPDV